MQAEYGTVNNKIIKNAAYNKNLAGYIKNSAWSYEKEVRLRIEVNDAKALDAVAIELTDELISSFIVVRSPRFSYSGKPILNSVSYTDSIFKEKLTWVYCDKCRKS